MALIGSSALHYLLHHGSITDRKNNKDNNIDILIDHLEAIFSDRKPTKKLFQHGATFGFQVIEVDASVAHLPEIL